MRTSIAAVLLAAAVSTLQIAAVIGDDIINGKKASKDSLQYMVSVQDNKTHNCGGFLISSKYVLTAAHCDCKHMTVVLGDHNIVPRKNLERYEVVRKFKKSFTNVLKGDDIMLLKLGREAVLGRNVKTVNIADKRRRVKRGTECLVAGWGKTKKAVKVNELLALNVSTVDIRECRKAWKKADVKRLPPNVICAGGYKQRAGVCLGDSGGPLVCDSVAVGIVSFVKTCNYPNVPNIYTDISKYSSWIKKMMNKRET